MRITLYRVILMGDIGSEFRARRTAAGRTVASVAAQAGLSVPYVANLENSRGNPTLGAVTRLAAALGTRLDITLAPDDESRSPAATDPPKIPSSLVRLARSPRFRETALAIAGSTGESPADVSARLVTALATLAGTLGRLGTLGAELAEPDWWRLLDAILLIAAHPAH
jgi:transcriptional regulator with XRE-family HTH domain